MDVFCADYLFPTVLSYNDTLALDFFKHLTTGVFSLLFSGSVVILSVKCSAFHHGGKKNLIHMSKEKKRNSNMRGKSKQFYLMCLHWGAQEPKDTVQVHPLNWGNIFHGSPRLSWLHGSGLGCNFHSYYYDNIYSLLVRRETGGWRFLYNKFQRWCKKKKKHTT